MRNILLNTKLLLFLFQLGEKDGKDVVKLADLGLAKSVKDITGTVCGTPVYMAPEVFWEKDYNEKVDMFAFGMVLWELWYGKCVVEAYQVTDQ